jgi:hypothetical protein
VNAVSITIPGSDVTRARTMAGPQFGYQGAEGKKATMQPSATETPAILSRRFTLGAVRKQDLDDQQASCADARSDQGAHPPVSLSIRQPRWDDRLSPSGSAFLAASEPNVSTK